jgi:hypothetical protein
MNKDVAARPQRGIHWKAARAIVLVFALAAGSMFLAGCSNSPTSAACAKKLVVASGSNGQSGVAGSTTTLPPSHDNDVGEGRIPDTHPDADVDANQRHKICEPSKSTG